MFNKIKDWFKPKPHWTEPGPVAQPTVETTQKAKRAPKASVELSQKDKATAAGEPYVAVLSVEVNPDNINEGAFELDWNDKFLLNCIKAGYKIKDEDTDAVIIDRWFHTVCRNVVLEIYEQNQADPDLRGLGRDDRIVRRKPLGDGRSEIS